jgi:hypothetical protein
MLKLMTAVLKSSRQIDHSELAVAHVLEVIQWQSALLRH